MPCAILLQVRTENLRESRSRQEAFTQGSVASSLPQSAVKGFHSGSVLAAMEDDERAAAAPANRSLAVSVDHGQAHSYMQQDRTDEYLIER